MSSAATALTKVWLPLPPGFTTNSASTASSCSTAGRQRPRARLSKTGTSPGIQPPKAKNAGAVPHDARASPSPRLFHYADQADPDWRERLRRERSAFSARMAAGTGSFEVVVVSATTRGLHR